MKLSKLTKVGESFTVYRYDNGYMFEVTGRDRDSDWKTCKILCDSIDSIYDLIVEYNNMELDS